MTVRAVPPLTVIVAAATYGAVRRVLPFRVSMPFGSYPARPYYLLDPLHDRAEALYRLGHWTAASAACTEALALAEELSQRDGILRCRVLGALIAFVRGEIVAAPAALEALLRETDEAADRAMLHYELWRMGQGDRHARAALALYQDLSERAPHAIYRTRIEELRAAMRDGPDLPV